MRTQGYSRVLTVSYGCLRGYSTEALGMQPYTEGCTEGAQGALGEYSPGPHGALEGYSASTQRVLTGLLQHWCDGRRRPPADADWSLRRGQATRRIGTQTNTRRKKGKQNTQARLGPLAMGGFACLLACWFGCSDPFVLVGCLQARRSRHEASTCHLAARCG